MTIQFTEDTNIRLRPDGLDDAAIVGQVFAPATLDVDDDLKTGTPSTATTFGSATETAGFIGPVGRGFCCRQPRRPIFRKCCRLPNPFLPKPGRPAQSSPTISGNPQPGFSHPQPPAVHSRFVADFTFPNLDDPAGATVIPPGGTRPAVLPKTGDSRAAESFSIGSPAAETGGLEPFFISTKSTGGETETGIPATRRAMPPPAQPPVFVEKSAPPRPVSGGQKPETVNWGIASLGIAEKFWQRGISGRGVKIAILSTGTDLACTDLDEAIEGVFLATNCGESMQDTDGIGTQAAVAAAGRGNGLAGVAPGASLFIGKIGTLDRLITPESLLEGLDWAIASGADIVAMLVDFAHLDEETERLFSEKIALATARNILLLAPVGNSTEKSPQRRYPAAWPDVLSVGAHDRAGQRSHFSAKSYELDLLAPGEGLASMGLGNQIFQLNAPSTAIATAFVAGALALMKEAERVGHLFLPAVKTLFGALKEAAHSPKSHVEKGEDVDFGHGLLRLPDLS